MNSFETWARGIEKESTSVITAGDVVSSSSGKLFGALQFNKVICETYQAEIAKKGEYYIYHFYSTISGFENILEKTLLEVFKHPDQIEMEYVPELTSWAVRVSGFTSTVWGDDMAIRVFSLLTDYLEDKV